MQHIKRYETFLIENTQTGITPNKQNDILNRINFKINIPIKGYELSYQDFNKSLKDYYSGNNTDIVDKIYNQYKKDIGIITDNINESFNIKNILILATIFILGVSCEKENVQPVIYKDKVASPPIKNMPPPYPNIPTHNPPHIPPDDNDSSNQFNNENTQYNTNFDKYQFNKLLNTIKFKINIPIKGYELSYNDFNRFLKDYYSNINTDIVDKIYNQYKKDIDIISDNLNENFTIKNILILATIFILGVSCEKENIKPISQDSIIQTNVDFENIKEVNPHKSFFMYTDNNKWLGDNIGNNTELLKTIKNNIINQQNYTQILNKYFIYKTNDNFKLIYNYEFNINADYDMYFKLKFMDKKISEAIINNNLISMITIETDGIAKSLNKEDINKLLNNSRSHNIGFVSKNVKNVKIKILYKNNILSDTNITELPLSYLITPEIQEIKDKNENQNN